MTARRGTSVRSGPGQPLPLAGTTGQALTKTSGTDLAVQWHTLTAADVSAAPSSGIAPSAITGTAVVNARQVISGTGLTGGGDMSADRTLVVTYGTSSTSAAVGNDSRLSDARNAKAVVVAAASVTGTYTADASTVPGTGGTFRLSLTGNVTLANPTNPTDGQTMTFELIQDATGSRTLTLGSQFSATADVITPVLTTTASKRDFLSVRYNSTTTKWYLMAFNRGA